MNLPKTVKIVEVGPRDGLQNETIFLDVSQKIELINKLISCGLSHIEAGSFVSPKWVPQMSTTSEVLKNLPNDSKYNFSILVPNEKGMEQAIAHNVKEIAIFTAASEAFTKKNINCSIDDSIKNFSHIIKQAKHHNIKVRGYVSCVLGCPYQGLIKPKDVAVIADKLYQLGCYEISLGDTIGVGDPKSTLKMLSSVSKYIPKQNLAVHFHDTYGQALANIYAALTFGITTIDSSVGGLGGCPYAKGAAGNVATEDVVYMLNNMSIKTNINLNKLIQVGHWIQKILNKSPTSKVSIAHQITS